MVGAVRQRSWAVGQLLSVLAAALALACGACGKGASTAQPDGGADGRVAGQCRAAAHALRYLEACGCDRDCPEGALCLDERTSGSPGGACAKVCDPNDATICGPGATCEVVIGTSGLCSPTCTTASDCPPLRACSQHVGKPTGVCYGICFADGDCDSGFCDPHAHVCAKPGVPAYTGPGGVLAACATDDDCRSGLCVAGRCVTRCSSALGDATCPDGAKCKKSTDPDLGVCFPRCTMGGGCSDPTTRCLDGAVCEPSMTGGAMCSLAAPPATDGLTCTCDADCLAGATCNPESVGGEPHGFCRRNCKVSASNCVSGSACSPTGGGNGICRASCAIDADCETTATCSTTSHVCFAVCQADAECLGGHCNRYSGYCEATPSSGLAMGAPCGKNADCKSQYCFVPKGQAMGFCTGFCDVRRQGCPDDAPCIDSSGGADGRCMRPCVVPADCAYLGATATCESDVLINRSYCAL